MTARKKKEVATVVAGAMATVPEYLKGIEVPVDDSNFDSSDIILPQIKLLQGVSDQIAEFDTAVIGDFWHTGLDESLSDSIDFVIINRRKKYLLLPPQGDNQGILARSDDNVTWDTMGKWDVQIDKRTTVTWTIEDLNVDRSGLGKWGSSFPGDPNSPPAATQFYEYMVLLKNRLEIGPCILSLARSQIATAKKGLNTKISMNLSMNRPLQCILYKATSRTVTNSSGQDYKNFVFIGGGFADEHLYNKAVELHKTMPFDNIEVQDEAKQEPNYAAVVDGDVPY